MKIENTIIEVETKQNIEMVDLTSQIRSFVEEKNMENGLVNISTTHTTSGIVINENEPGLLEDMKNHLEKLAPKSANYEHDKVDDRKNAHSHIKSIGLNPNQTIPIIDSQLKLGTWQSIFFIELDGPRQRKVNLTIIGE